MTATEVEIAGPMGPDHWSVGPIRYRYSVWSGRYLVGVTIGKFWVPSHARGKGGGDPTRDYTLIPGR